MKQLKRGDGSSDFWRTPRELFDALNREFHFGLDLAADASSSLCGASYLGPGSELGEDALYVDWPVLNGPAFLNPPYSDIEPWIARAADYAAHGLTTVMLIPYSVDVVWWRHAAHRAAEIRAIPHRVPFLKRDGIAKAGAMFASAVVVFRPQPGIVGAAPPRSVVWDYRP